MRKNMSQKSKGTLHGRIADGVITREEAFKLFNASLGING